MKNEASSDVKSYVHCAQHEKVSLNSERFFVREDFIFLTRLLLGGYAKVKISFDDVQF